MYDLQHTRAVTLPTRNLHNIPTVDVPFTLHVLEFRDL